MLLDAIAQARPPDVIATVISIGTVVAAHAIAAAGLASLLCAESASWVVVKQGIAVAMCVLGEEEGRKFQLVRGIARASPVILTTWPTP